MKTKKEGSRWAPTKRALRLHKETIVIDALAFPYICEDAYLERVRRGGVAAAIVTVAYDDSFDSAVRKIDALHEQVAARPEDLVVALTAEDIRQAKGKNKVAVILGFQDTKPLGDDLQLLRTFYRLGVRCIQLVYNGRNVLGDGCCEESDCGLSFAGRDVIAEMNRLGMLIDLSHCGDRTTMDAIRASAHPVAFTHANARAVYASVRNKTDEQLVALAEKNGVAGVTSHPAFVNHALFQPTLDDLLEHIDHMVKLIGIDHVGIGMDFVEKMKETNTVLPASVYWRARRPDVFGTVEDAVDKPYATGIGSIAELPNLTQGLLNRGYQEGDVKRILGGNFLRLFERVCG